MTTIVAGQWESIGPDGYSLIASGHTGGVGRVTTLEIDPSDHEIIYACTPGGGLWRTNNGGTDWEPLTDGMPKIGISDLAIDYTSPVNNRTIYALTGDADGNHTQTIGVC